MRNNIVFTITNDFTGVRVDVHKRGPRCFDVELTDIDAHEYVGTRTFQRESEAIDYAVLCS